MKQIIFFLFALIVIGCGGDNKKSSEYDPIENNKPVNLSGMLNTYDAYQNGNQERKDSILWSFVDSRDYEIFLFTDTSFVLRLPEFEGSDVPFLAFAEDFYNACSFTWSIWSNHEVWLRGHSADELRSDKDILDGIKAIDARVFKDKELRMDAESYKDSMLMYLSMNINDWDDAHNPRTLLDTYSKRMSKRVNRVFDNSADIQKELDSTMYAALDLGRSKYKIYEAAETDERLKVVLRGMNSCNSFDEQCSLWMLWGNGYKPYEEEAWMVAVGKKLMDSGKYSPLLFNVWLAWRSLCQLNYYGASRDSDIPNNFYNEYRKMCYVACLKRIEKFPDDIITMRFALSFAGSPNLNRFGENPIGNEALIELYQLMPKHLDVKE